MSKVTFRADDDLVRRIEAFDTSKSEVLRRALREYLDSHGPADASDASTDATGGSIDDLVERRVEAVLDERLGHSGTQRAPQDVNVNVTLEVEPAVSATNGRRARDTSQTNSAPGQTRSRQSDDTSRQSDDVGAERGHTHERDTDDRGAPGGTRTESEGTRSCAQCGEAIDPEHVYCPNCGEKAARRLFCECGDEIRSDWAFCPSCGRRTPAADVLEADRANPER